MSETQVDKLPEPKLPEYAFIGRSNVGKSSLINMLTNHKSLARISGQPGKTQSMVSFLINDNWYLMDLPGYGYAKVSKTQREKWQRMINKYIKERTNLMVLFVLIDARLEPQPIDIEFVNMLGEKGVPFNLVFTKSDKVGGNKAAASAKAFLKVLSEDWEELPHYFITSAEDGRGRTEILTWIEETNALFKPKE